VTEPHDPDPDELRRLYMDGVIEGVALVNADANSCETCAAVGNQTYLPWELPKLPIPGCTTQGGCRCRAEPQFTVVE